MTDPPFAGIVGAAIARMKDIPFVYNIRDLYPDMALGGEIVRPRTWVGMWERMHRRALRRAARVIVLGDDMRDRIVAKGIDPQRVVVVRDGASASVIPAQPDDPAIREIRGSAEFVVLHAGNLGFYGAWNTLLEAAGCSAKWHSSHFRRRWCESSASGRIQPIMWQHSIRAIPPGK